MAYPDQHEDEVVAARRPPRRHSRASRVSPHGRTETQYSTRPWTHATLVWYESPFGPPEWMELSQANKLLAMETKKFEDMRAASGTELLWSPRIIDRQTRLAELAGVVGGPRSQRL